MNFSGTDANDVITGTGGTDRIEGLDGDDELAGGAGADTIIGGDGDDILFSYRSTTLPIYENDFSIILDDNAQRDTLSGGAGSDLIFAGAGDSIDGGDGDDRLAISFKGSLDAVAVDFGALTRGEAMTIGKTRFNSIEEIAWVRGSDFGDTLDFTNASIATNLRIEGGGGDDHIVAADNYARVYGGDGNDDITSGYFALGGDGDDRIVAAAGSYLTLFVGDAGADVLIGSSGVDNLRGGTGADTLTGGDGNDIIASASTENQPNGNFYEWTNDLGLEKDRIDAGAGDDEVYVGYGDDADGGLGIDHLSISLGGATSGVTIDTAKVMDGTATLGDGTITGFEVLDRVRGSEFDDTITTGATFVEGSGGNDLIIATGKLQDLLGGAGDDRFLSNGLGEYIYGDAGYLVVGNDTVDYSRLTKAVAVTLGDLYSDYSSDSSTVGTSSVGDTLREIENIVGTARNDRLSGNASANHIEGGAGNDAIIGGRGADWLDGGDGNDVVTITPTAVSVDYRLSGGAGLDTLAISYPAYSSVDFTGAAVSGFETLKAAGLSVTMNVSQVQSLTAVNVGSLKLTDSGTVNFSAGAFTGALYLSDFGNRAVLDRAGTNRVFGGAGADAIIGGAGIEIVRGGGGADLIDGGSTANSAAANQLFGEDGDDRLVGGQGADLLDGGAGKDRMQGGLGNDRYVVETVGDTVFESANAGTDSVLSSISFALAADIENLTLTGNAANATGNALANVITGNGAANVLNGGGGADRLIGGYGDDIYIVDAGDRILENSYEGIDTVRAFADFVLGENLENLALFGDARSGKGNAEDNRLTGTAGDDTLAGMDGNDVIDGGAGADRMGGGNGDDSYTVDSSADVIIEAANGGADSVTASADFVLSENIETLVLTAGARVGTGNSGANVISGSSGDDILSGMGGNDVLAGGLGSDTIVGGTGQDALFGAGGADRFVFRAGDTGNSYLVADGIVDFSQGEGDRIDVSSLGSLRFVGSAAFSGHAGEVRYEGFDGDTLVSIDTNGDRQADVVIGMIGSFALNAADFILG